jgi:hypothetical protein
MKDGPEKFHTGYLVEGLELLIRKVAYTKYDATWLVPWSNYNKGMSPASALLLKELRSSPPAVSLCICLTERQHFCLVLGRSRDQISVRIFVCREGISPQPPIEDGQAKILRSNVRLIRGMHCHLLSRWFLARLILRP